VSAAAVCSKTSGSVAIWSASQRLYAAETPSSTEPIAGSATSAAVIPVATATTNTAVPTMIAIRYLRACRAPKTEPTAARLIVAGPGLHVTASEMRMSGGIDLHRIAGNSNASGIAAAIPVTHAADATRRRC
jgi:hypothetical protein